MPDCSLRLRQVRSELLAAVFLLGATVGTQQALAVGPCSRAASLTVFVDNLSRDEDVTLALEGELRDPSATCTDVGQTTYTATVVCHGRGVVECGSIAELRPGAWIHRVTTTVTDSAEQRQTASSVVLAADSASNVVKWTVFARTFAVDDASEGLLRSRLDEASAFNDATGERALVTFDRDVFPGADDPRTITLSRGLCADDGRHAGLCVTGSDIVIDAVDARDRTGAVVLDIGAKAAPVLRIYGARNVVRGLVLQGSSAAGLSAQADTIAIAGPGAEGNRIERCVVRGPTFGDAVSVEHGAGSSGFDNVVVDSELTGAAGVGLKATTSAHAVLMQSCVHDNRNGGASATLGGRLVANANLVQHNAPGNAPAGLAAGSSGEHGPRSTLISRANIVRFNGARGISVTDDADATFSDDYVSDNQFAGARVEAATPGGAPGAVFAGVALVCNHNDGLSGTCEPSLDPNGTPCLTDHDCCGAGAGCCVDDPTCLTPVVCKSRAPQGYGAVIARCDQCASPAVDFGTGDRPGWNAFTLNRNTYPNALGVSFQQGLPGETTPVSGDQWEHCGTGASCDVAAVSALDVQLAADAGVDLGAGIAGRAGAPVITDVSIGRPRAGDVVRIFGRGFDAIDGAACAKSTTPVDPCSAENPRVEKQNRSRYGHQVQITTAGSTTAVDVSAVTPTMLAFRMPFDCFDRASVRVSRRDAGDVRRTATIDLCDAGGCKDRASGEPCDDGSVCTVEDQCGADGRCISGLPLDCGGQCMRCDPVAGCRPRSSDSPCDDGNACTVGDHCRGDGDVCVPGAPRACEGSCLSGICDSTLGCEPAPPTTSCDDGNACTIDDHCRGDADLCIGGGALVCKGACLTGRCDPGTGCRARLSTAFCSDGDACTDHDHCSGDADVCVSGGPKDCDDGDPCSVDACDSASGCNHTPLARYDAVRCRLDQLREQITGPGGLTGSPRVGLTKAVVRTTARAEEARLADARADLKTARRRLATVRSALRRLRGKVDRARGFPPALPTAMLPVIDDVAARVDALRAELGARIDKAGS